MVSPKEQIAIPHNLTARALENYSKSVDQICIKCFPNFFEINRTPRIPVGLLVLTQL